MMLFFTYIYKLGNYFFRFIQRATWIIVFLKFKLNRISFYSDFKSNGIPVTSISLGSKVAIGKSFMMNNGKYHNKIGRQQPCYFIVNKNAELTIKNNVGISAVAIVCWKKICIGNNVKIGGGTVVYDTDFHSLNWEDRLPVNEDSEKVKTAPVIINDNVFIGANTTILKGVEIGEKAIIGACSVVTKSVPAGEVWAGNPAKFIRKIEM